MSDAPPPDGPLEPTLAPPEEIVPEVAYVVPAPAYEAIATDDGLAIPPGPPPAATAPADPDPGPALEAAIGSLGEALGRRLDALQAVFEREVRAEAAREKIVDRLHAELQDYKQDLLLGVLRPVFVDLIQLHDDVGKLVEASPAPADGEAVRLRAALAGVQQGIEDILYRQGVEPFAEDGTAFDPRRQRALETVPTDDPALARTVASRRRPGFRAGERVIRPELVSVYALRR